MKNNDMNTIGKGESSYDAENDILIFKIKNRDYFKSIEFDDDNLTVEIDHDGVIMGFSFFDASQTLGLNKSVINTIKQFSFVAKVDGKKLFIRLKFEAYKNPKSLVNYSQDFIREITDLNIINSNVECSAQ